MKSVAPLALLLAAACTPDEPEGFVWPESTASAVSDHAAHVEQSYADALTGARALDTALEALVAGPTESTLASARQAWLDSRPAYLRTEVFRFSDGPIDNPDDGPEGLLNAWPLDENYIDYVVGNDAAGIVNGTDLIDGDALASLNEQGGEKNIATGYHAIEFLLWGQDLSDTGPGERPHTDFVTDGSGTAANQDRRGQYLTVAGDLLVANLEQVHDAWAPTAPYRTGFEGAPEESFGRVLTGMIILSGFETGGERLQAALDSGDREDEHSCFSDNTKVDMVEDVRGIQAAWAGSIEGVVAEAEPELAAQITARIDESLQLAEALENPFEHEIDPTNAAGNARVQALIDSLRTQEGLLEDVFIAFGLSVPVPE
ncbi:MAG: imelysin family protein [Myxococcota bacterium]